ncbi:MAG: 1-deoxy-D-xylulose-5-phosphate reductoisomerase [Clostridia bacterium]|nr:1-deoxy-D-xylulose-5-phosphate reductoisomerase [Clostridia bacterium]
MKVKRIALLGSTGSIGTQVLKCVERYPERFEIVSLCAGKNAALLSEQIKKFRPKVAALSDASCACAVKEIPAGCDFYYGEAAAEHAIVSDADLVFVAIMGFAGLKCVVTAINMGKDVAIANKETLVAGGELVIKLAKEKGVNIYPVDSEHSAIWQSLSFDTARPFKRIIITASGGAFRDTPIEELKYKKAKDALAHPNWNMGAKITVDCATMVNKGLEVIEAHWLFNAPYEKINVLMHPESIVHSLVEFADGAIINQMGYPSMELPIMLAMSYPERLAGAPVLDLAGKTLHFFEMDKTRYPCFDLVIESAKTGDNYPCALSAANEEAVALFLQDKIAFTDIYGYLSDALDKTKRLEPTLENLLTTDRLARLAVYKKFNGN